MRRFFYTILLLGVIQTLGTMQGHAASAQAATASQAATNADWQAMAKYRHGQDLAPLLAIDAEVTAAMNDPQKRRSCAERLAALLEAPETTLAAKQFICLKLRVVGASEQVPVLAGMLDDPKTAEMARMTLRQIPGKASMESLRAALKKVQGDPTKRGLLLGLINSVADRKDATSVDAMKKLADSQDVRVASSAIWALGRIASPEAIKILTEKVAKTDSPLPLGLAVPYFRSAWHLSEKGETDAARAIFRRMSNPGEVVQNRQAALHGLLHLEEVEGADRFATVRTWLAGNNPLKRQVAAEQLAKMELDEKMAKTLLDSLPRLPVAGKALLIEILAAKQVKAARPAALELVKSDEPAIKLAAIRALGTIGDAGCVPILVKEIAGATPYRKAAKESLTMMPGSTVDRAILSEVKKTDKGELSGQLIRLLTHRKAAIDASNFFADAANKNISVHLPAIVALRNLGTLKDVPSMIDLMTTVSDRKHRGEIEKTIFLVCNKVNRKKTDPAAVVLSVYSKADEAKRCVLLPLLGRLGGRKSLEVVTVAMGSRSPKLRKAGIRALCNWPDASVAGRLLDMVKTSKNRSHRVWALRAYIRVVSLKSDRPEAKTLAMLQNAFRLADSDSERGLAIRRAVTVRTIETLRWVVPYLDRPGLSEAAACAVVELAHHRFLRIPNRAEFDAALKKVIKTSKNPEITDRANRYLLGT